jgi:hypothetical protein
MRNYLFLTITVFIISTAMVFLIPLLFAMWLSVMEWSPQLGTIITVTLIGTPILKWYTSPLSSEGIY